jgi:hypothetical protein
MYLLVTARKDISSLQLAKEIGVTQKTAWFILGRLREACGDGPGGGLDKLRGTVEVDECFVGGLEAQGQADHVPEAHSMKPPEELGKIADMVLNYHPKLKAKAAKKRKKKAARKGKG